jgi:hypothetical protein
MYHRAPRSLPPLSVLLDALPGKPADCAKYLEVSPRTLRRWMAADYAPRPYMLALYWESNYGLAHIDADLFNLAQQHAAMAKSLEREVKRLQAVIDRLEKDHDWGSANAPIFNAL